MELVVLVMHFALVAVLAGWLANLDETATD